MALNTKFKKPSEEAIQKHSKKFYLMHSIDPMYVYSIVRFEKLVLLFLGSKRQERTVDDLISIYKQ